MEKIKLPSCKTFKDGLTGATHKVCPVINQDHGERGLMVSSYDDDKLLSNIGEVANWGRELKLRRQDQSTILKMASKTFRESRKIEKEASAGGGYGIFTGWFKGRKSTSI